MEIKNIFVNMNDGAGLLIYTSTLTEKEVEKWVNKAAPTGCTEAYEISNAEMQYYCIDDRIWADTPEKEQRVRAFIAD